MRPSGRWCEERVAVYCTGTIESATCHVSSQSSRLLGRGPAVQCPQSTLSRPPCEVTGDDVRQALHRFCVRSVAADSPVPVTADSPICWCHVMRSSLYLSLSGFRNSPTCLSACLYPPPLRNRIKHDTGWPRRGAASANSSTASCVGSSSRRAWACGEETMSQPPRPPVPAPLPRPAVLLVIRRGRLQGRGRLLPAAAAVPMAVDQTRRRRRRSRSSSSQRGTRPKGVPCLV